MVEHLRFQALYDAAPRLHGGWYVVDTMTVVNHEPTVVCLVPTTRPGAVAYFYASMIAQSLNIYNVSTSHIVSTCEQKETPIDPIAIAAWLDELPVDKAWWHDGDRESYERLLIQLITEHHLSFEAATTILEAAYYASAAEFGA